MHVIAMRLVFQEMLKSTLILSDDYSLEEGRNEENHYDGNFSDYVEDDNVSEDYYEPDYESELEDFMQLRINGRTDTEQDLYRKHY